MSPGFESGEKGASIVEYLTIPPTTSFPIYHGSLTLHVPKPIGLTCPFLEVHIVPTLCFTNSQLELKETQAWFDDLIVAAPIRVLVILVNHPTKDTHSEIRGTQ
jgi:hypothetical protein